MCREGFVHPTSWFNSQSAGGGEVVTHGSSTTSDGAGGGDVVSHSMSCKNVDMLIRLQPVW